MSQNFDQPSRIEGDVNSEVVRARLRDQTDLPTMVICPICWDTLCGYDVEARKDQVIVSWNGCGHTFHRSCIELNSSSGLPQMPGGYAPHPKKCPVCNASPVYIRYPSHTGGLIPFTRIYLSGQDRVDVLPLTVNFHDGTSAHFSVNALAQTARTEIEIMRRTLEGHLGASRTIAPGQAEGLQVTCSSFETVVAQLERLIIKFRASQSEDIMGLSLHRLNKSTLSLQEVCDELKQGQELRNRIVRAKRELQKLEEERDVRTAELAKLDGRILQLKKGVSDAELVKSERMQLLCLDKEFALRARYDNQQQRDRQEMRGVIASLEQQLVTATNENAKIQHELQYYRTLARNNRIGITHPTLSGHGGGPIR